ncbi:PREDICTED: ankyrin-1-like [Dufourea novaeangliae]|uniref:ankyrin-1-like n=1 Tax=Dufourea novaeangliae TaxID=178035 RepID=UPI00076763F5|nr:PREDICTED: ankyrin-1-like [Dufourea novaeangliae]
MPKRPKQHVVIVDPVIWPESKTVNVNWKLLQACTVRHYNYTQGANVNCRTTDFLTPIHIAVEHNDVTMIQLLCSQPSLDIESTTMHGLTPLHVATFLGHKEALKKLLENGASVNCRDTLGRYPLHYAALRKDVSSAILLLRKNANVNGYDVFHESPLYTSVIRRPYFPMIKLLLFYGATVSSSSGQYSLGLLLESILSIHTISDMSVFDLLFRNETDVNTTDFIGLRTPMHIAAMTGNLLLAVYLIEKGADLSRKTRAGLTPMQMAMAYNNIEIVKLIQKTLSET